MRRIFIIGGMGAGKSSVRTVLAEEGLICIDLDEIGHKVLLEQSVKTSLVQAFGADILHGSNEIDRGCLATKAFSSEEATRLLNSITRKAIKETFEEKVRMLEQDGYPCVVVEFSAFDGRDGFMVGEHDIVIAVVAPVEARVQRAVAKGWMEDDVRRRIDRQITDEERSSAADVVFENAGDQGSFEGRVRTWWQENSQTL